MRVIGVWFTALTTVVVVLLVAIVSIMVSIFRRH